ncbi:MAG TPA: DUF433 domain-containing protein [Candidatus Binatia bacterium]|nr:DUF433 domain-containing protein [Candidatus Binatia bacterium]
MTNPLLTRITSDPAIFGGKPIIRGMRFAVEHLIGYLDAGTSEKELSAEFPFLKPEDITVAKLFAARQDERLSSPLRGGVGGGGRGGRPSGKFTAITPLAKGRAPDL